MRVQKVCQSLVVILFLMTPSISLGDIIQDDFNDNDLNPNLWTSFGQEPNMYAIETNNRLEIRSDGTQNDSAGIRLNTFISVDQDFIVQVDFNGSDCWDNAVIGLVVANACTDIQHSDEYVAMCNGEDDANGMVTRSWLAVKTIDDTIVDSEIQSTFSTSGTLYIEHKGATFYVSFTGYEAQNALASVYNRRLDIL